MFLILSMNFKDSLLAEPLSRVFFYYCPDFTDFPTDSSRKLDQYEWELDRESKGGRAQ